MMVRDLAFSFGLVLGVLAFAGFSAWTYIRTQAPPLTEWTATLVYRSGQAALWAAALLLAGGILGGAAAVMWRAVGG